ncbi:hypothetical protein [Rhizobium sp. NFR03]|uniref:hypothetical protein n=1 Tax=Rhizobium sp. NFR03 TaxID=1566263 RepID=UPI0008B3944D|nr:hypothetical protein [Rhizobium sp. NFR03]SES38172.1 hypothetical protein SAMN03159406_03865 [Rhizobium sp. NFR03]
MSNNINAAGEAAESVILNITRQIGEAAGCRDDRDDQIAALRTELSQHKATTLEEAAVQICDLTNRLGFVLEQLPQEADVTQQDRSAIMRLAFSVLDVLAQATRQKPEAIIHDGFSDQHLSPWFS